ncbi:MAG: bifunctional aspartate kinase/homoserine dehydrogenase I [Bacteroidetes bacterium]|nr:MAG: bifunctional aspartate kinase/homoserine dehydrogenase I [Bacteroidota bacterium]
MKVIKFGGSCLRSRKDIKNLKNIVINSITNEKAVIIVSAFQGITDHLEKCGTNALKSSQEFEKDLIEIEHFHLSLAGELFTITHQSEIKAKVKMMLNEIEDICTGISFLHEFTLKTKDSLIQYGELLSSFLISEYLKTDGKLNIEYADARKMLVTDDNFGKANPDIKKSFEKIKKQLSGKNKTYVIPGFIAATPEGKVTTLGREGSDYSAALIASAMQANILEKWTNVDGIMTADPSLVKSAFPIPELSYNEAMELAHFGAKVIYPPTLYSVFENKIPILIRNAFEPGNPGTKIHAGLNNSRPAVIGLSNIPEIVLLTLSGSGMVGIPGISKRMFSVLAEKKVNIIFITQASSEHSITIGVNQDDLKKAKKAISEEFYLEIEIGKVHKPDIEQNQSIIAIVGDRMKRSVGLAGKAFSSLGKNGVNIRSIAQGSSERNISMVVHQGDLKKAMNVLHERFFLSGTKQLHLFLIGTGNVGSALLQQIDEQIEYLKQEHSIVLNLTGIANSKKMLFQKEGIPIHSWKQKLEKNGQKMNPSVFLENVTKLNLRNTIFIDETASESIIPLYQQFLEGSINVVTSNKIAASSGFERYRKLIDTARAKNVKFLYETNVGAGLPLIRTIHDLINSGDRITGFQAVLSGSLNFILNSFNEKMTFSKTVQKAQEAGFTEPDPRIDLNGTDVKRKLLILARECGYQIEMEDIESLPFVPETSFSAPTKDAFIEKLSEQDVYFEKMRKSAIQNKKKLRYVADFKPGKATVGLLEVNEVHPFYELDGKDNILMLYTRLYEEQPMVIKGAGAGAEVTAAGVFADIMRIAIG